MDPTPEWLIASLWGPNAPKVVLGLVDTILLQDGKPSLWLFTSKKGQVVKKKHIDKPDVVDRILKIALSSTSNTSQRVAIGYFQDGHREVWTREAFLAVLASFPQLPKELVAIQPYICTKGQNLTLYRNEANRMDRNRTITSTVRTSLLNSKDTTNVVSIPNNKIIFDIRSSASAINSKLDEITTGIIKQIERLRHIRVEKVGLDYAIDEDGQIWMLWAGKIQISSVPRVSKDTSSPAEIEKDQTMAAETLLARANSTIVPTREIQSKKQRQKKESWAFGLTNDTVGARNSYPTPFKCSGKFCHLKVAESEKEKQSLIPKATKFLFSDAELKVLSQNQSKWSIKSVDETLYTITYKSIALANDEKRGLEPSSEIETSTSRFMKQTESMTLKTNWAKSIGEIGGGASNYYRQVKVCSNCHSIYAMLDLARDMVGKEAAAAVEREKEKIRMSWDKQVDQKVERMESILRREHSTVVMKESHSMPELTPVMTERATILPTLVEPERTEPQDNARDLEYFEESREETRQEHRYNPNDRPRPWVKEKKNSRTKRRSTPEENGVCTAEEYNHLDSYLRGKARRRAKKVLHEGQLFSQGEPAHCSRVDKKTMRVARVLIVEPDDRLLHDVSQVLQGENYIIERMSDGNLALESLKRNFYNVAICARDLPGIGAVELTKLLRLHETQRSIANGKLPERTKVICFTDETTPDEMCIYMESGMDGCVSKPLDPTSLLRTMAAALPEFQHVTPTVDISSDLKKKKKKPKTSLRKKHTDLVTNGAINPLPVKAQQNVAASYGRFQMDADTVIPYAVIRKAQTLRVVNTQTMFNLVVVHDFFDTYERMQIFLQPLLSRYPGVQVLLWNYPGQAFTECRKDVLLNNEYLSGCLTSLLHHVGQDGTREFSPDPFVLLGFGNGGNIGMAYAAGFPASNMRALLLMNSFSHVDASLSNILHDCMNVFSCTHDERPDLPVYCYSRYLFSQQYLYKVTTPMALNLYTAVHNPITIDGRIQLCLGALSHADMRPALAAINMPVVTLCSSDDSLVRPLHADAIVAARGGEHPSIHKVFQTRKKTCVVWIKSGHEVFQEAKESVEMLLEQFITGYHEKYDVPQRANQLCLEPQRKDNTKKKIKKPVAQNFEDRFIDNVLSTLGATASHPEDQEQEENGDETRQQWSKFQQNAEQMSKKLYSVTKQKPKGKGKAKAVHDSKNRSKTYSNPDEVPEMKEYMQWRINMNKKRLKHLEKCAHIIQRAFRAFLARTLTIRMRQTRAALYIQRNWRGKVARRKFTGKRKKDWAIRLVQRSWRGRQGRQMYQVLRTRRRAAIIIQRHARGINAREYVRNVRKQRHEAAIVIQSVFQQHRAKLVSFRQRQLRNASITLQRTYRGYLGRKRAKAERDRFLFSKSQSQGIEFGRQMLLEHKLHGTRLQSEVALLAKEKTATEQEVETLLDEIAEFEEGVRMLEHEMHEVSKVETEAAGMLDEDARWQMREQKMRLDREFGSMLNKIAERKERLQALETKLQMLDRQRQQKEEDLRELEKKLVVLLEDQQKELQYIKSKQESRSQALIDISAGNRPPGAILAHASGVSLKQREEANALVESTETMMKFGFMSMSMTYFSSMNMIKAMRKVGAHQTLLDGADAASQRLGAMAQASGGGLDGQVPGQAYQPKLKPGELPGQEPLQVTGWSVGDVGRWLDTLSLGQYKAAFSDAAVDGAFLYDLNDSDLRNTLGIEHGLHRKKILNSVDRLRVAEGLKMQNLTLSSNQPAAQSTSQSPVVNSAMPTAAVASPLPGNANAPAQQSAPDSQATATPAAAGTVTAQFDELATMVRHGKYKSLKTALDPLPTRPFDPSTVKVQFVAGEGTVYDDATERHVFHINKGDDKGNSLLLLAGQNNSIKIAELLVKKGANPDHQNKQGQTAGHYAMAYNFFDLGAWLLDPEKGGGRDDVENMYNLTPYDGLS